MTYVLRFLLLAFSLEIVSASADLRYSSEDDVGNLIELEVPPERIVSLAPHLTEMLFSIGVGDRIVATVLHSDFPEEAAAIPVLGDAFSIGVESVVAIDPDLILAWTTGGNQRALKQLSELGYPIFFGESERLEDIGVTVERIAALVGQSERGEKLRRSFDQELNRLRAEGRTQPSRSVFFQISDSRLFTVNRKHLIGQAIELCNGDNIFAETPVMVPMVSLENMVALNPEVIIVSNPQPNLVSSWSDEWRRLGWSDRIRAIDASLITRPSLRMLEGIREMCNLLRD